MGVYSKDLQKRVRSCVQSSYDLRSSTTKEVLALIDVSYSVLIHVNMILFFYGIITYVRRMESKDFSALFEDTNTKIQIGF